MPISDIVEVTISRETQSVSKAGFGVPLFLGESDVLPTKDVVVIIFDADLVANDTTTVKINGTALSGILFNSDNDTTLQLIADAIQSVANVESAVITGTPDNIITVTGKVDLSVTVNSAIVVNTVPGSEAEATISRTAAARIRFYASLVEVAVDYAETDPEYIAASECFAQPIAPSSVAIGRKNSALVDVVTITLDATLVTDNVFGADINGVALAGAGLTWNSDESTTMTAIAAVIQALTSVTTCVASDVGTVGFKNTLTITGASGFNIIVTDEAITLGASQATLIVARIDGESYTQALAKIVEESDDWYALAIESRTDANILLVAAWIETQKKLFGLASSDTDILGTGSADIAGQLETLNYDRTLSMFNELAATIDPEFAWFGKMLPTDPGSATWMFKTLTGIVATTLTSAQRTNALAKNCNIYHEVGGVDMTEEGKVASGEYIDIIRGIDWLQARMMEKIFGHLVNSPKIPFIDAGIAVIEADVRAILDLGIARGLIALTPAYTVTVPLAADVSSANKIARNLPDIIFQATLAGAIHHVGIAGIVTV